MEEPSKTVFVVLRPKTNIGRRVLFGLRVDTKIEPDGGIVVKDELTAVRIVQYLTKRGIVGWTYVPTTDPRHVKAAAFVDVPETVIVRAEGALA